MTLLVKPMVADLSHYQNVRDWKRVKAAGIYGVINKATEGTSIVDKTFAIRREPARMAGLLYGAYHFLRPGSVKAQVDAFLRATDPDDHLLLALDHEDRRVPLDAAKEFLAILRERTHRQPVLYSGFLIKEQLGNRIDHELAGYRFWLAQYSAHPTWPATWREPWLWQFTGDGTGPTPHSIDGIDGTGLDIDSYQGTPTQLAAEWTGMEASTTVNDPPIIVSPTKPPPDIPVIDAEPAKPAASGFFDALIAFLRAIFSKGA